MSASKLKLTGLPAVVSGSEYEEFPRGRVVYNVPGTLFTIYADRRLQGPPIIAAICRTFCSKVSPLSCARIHIIRDVADADAP